MQKKDYIKPKKPSFLPARSLLKIDSHYIIDLNGEMSPAANSEHDTIATINPPHKPLPVV